MSRCVLDNEEARTEVVVGWDPGAQTFFARVFDHRKARAAKTPPGDEDAYEAAGLVLWITGVDAAFDEPGAVVEMVERYAAPFDRAVLERELLADKANDDGERNYTVEGSVVEDF